MCFVSSLTQLYLCQQHFGRILNIFLDLDKELHGFSAVQKSMVICKGKVHHLAVVSKQNDSDEV